MKSNVVVFEGPDNTGKTSSAIALTKLLGARGINACYFAFPGKKEGTLGATIYAIEQDPQRFGILSMSAASRQALHLAAHLDAIENQIRPFLQSNGFAILDRYWWSLIAYGRNAGVSEKTIAGMAEIEKQTWGDISPLAIFTTLRNSPLTEPKDEKWAGVLRQYAALAKSASESCPVIDVTTCQSATETAKYCLAWIIKQAHAL